MCTETKNITFHVPKKCIFTDFICLFHTLDRLQNLDVHNSPLSPEKSLKSATPKSK